MMASRVLLLLLLQLTSQLSIANADSQDSAAITLIKETINLFPITVDNHRTDLVDQVFTPNATVDIHLAESAPYSGYDELKQLLSTGTGAKSQHGLTTQHVDLFSTHDANATAYLFANFFGQGSLEGQIFTVYSM